MPQLRRRLPRLAIAFAADLPADELAELALERGVRETLTRPVAPAALRLLLQRSADQQRERVAHGLVQRALRRELDEHPIVAATPAMIAVLEEVERAAGHARPALIEGEPGVGKESIARAIHAQSARRAAPFVALSCSGVPSSYVESELFGRARSEFADAAPARRGLLAEARGGTLFLDEIGALPPGLQVRLAGSLAEGATEVGHENHRVEIDVRVIASTHRDLEREAKAGHFDSELLGLFDPEPIAVPPLRDRRDDIPLLADHLLRTLATRHGKAARSLADDALELLTQYPWPGNARELENTLERAVLFASGDRITRRELPDELQRSGSHDDDDDVWALRPARRAAETAAIRRALAATGGNRTHAAKRLRISQRALLYKLKEYEIRD